jgi:hypothetical protein
MLVSPTLHINLTSFSNYYNLFRLIFFNTIEIPITYWIIFYPNFWLMGLWMNQRVDLEDIICKDIYKKYHL